MYEEGVFAMKSCVAYITFQQLSYGINAVFSLNSCFQYSTFITVGTDMHNVVGTSRKTLMTDLNPILIHCHMSNKIHQSQIPHTRMAFPRYGRACALEVHWANEKICRSMDIDKVFVRYLNRFIVN